MGKPYRNGTNGSVRKGPKGRDPNDALGLFLDEVGQQSLLSSDQERELTERIETLRSIFEDRMLQIRPVFNAAVELLEQIAAERTSLQNHITQSGRPDINLNYIQTRVSEIKNLGYQMESRNLVKDCNLELEFYTGHLKRLLACGPNGHVMTNAQARLRTDILRAWAGYKREIHELASKNLKLVISVARRYRNRGMEFTELIQEGNCGLMRATELFQSKLGYRFSTYATWWIRQSVYRSILEKVRTIRVPAHVFDDLIAFERQLGSMMHALGKMPTIEEIMTGTGRSKDSISNLMSLRFRSPFSLDTPIDGNGDDPGRMGDLLDLSHSDQTIVSEIDHRHLSKKVEEVLKSLTFREREVIKLRFGLKDGIQRTLEETGRAFKITRERARQIEAKAIKKLQSPVRAHHLQPHYDE